MRQLNYHRERHFHRRFRLQQIAAIVIRRACVPFASASSRVLSPRACDGAAGERKPPAPPVATPTRHAEPRQGAARQPGRNHLQVRRAPATRTFDRGLPRHRPRRRRRRRADVDRRSQSADADHAVEARADDRVHADHLRAGLPVRRRGDDPDRAVLDGRRRSGCRWRATTRASTRTRWRTLQLLPQTENSSPSSRTAGTRPKSPSTTPRRVAVDQEGRDARRSRTRRRTACSTSTSTTPAASSTSRSR